MANSLRSEPREAIVLYLANGTKVMSRHVTPFRKRYFTFRALSSNVYSISRQIQWTFNQAEGRVVLHVVQPPCNFTVERKRGYYDVLERATHPREGKETVSVCVHTFTTIENGDTQTAEETSVVCELKWVLRG